MTARPILAAAAAFAWLLFSPAPQAAQAADAGVQAQADAWSAARKRYRTVRPYYRAPYDYGAYATPRYGYGRLGDPSIAPNGLPYQRPYDPGGCIIDEGYGRFSSCSNR